MRKISAFYTDFLRKNLAQMNAFKTCAFKPFAMQLASS